MLNLSSDAEIVADTRRMMDRQLAHMVRLIDDLLDVSRIANDKLTLRRERVLLQTIAESAVEASRPFIEASGHSLTLTLPDEPVWLAADAIRLAQVVSNLLTNAAKYTPEGGSIELAAAREAGEVVVNVTDTGIGIPPEMQAQVFEMFTQVNRALDRSQGGLGIGLALVKRLVELHGGTITAHSPGLNKGSTFTVRLPLVDGYPAETGPRPIPAARRQAARRRAGGCWWLMITWTGPRLWRGCWDFPDIRPGSPIAARRPWMRLARSNPRWFSSTSVFPA